MKIKQIAVIAGIAVVVGYLYMLPVKGLVKPKEQKPNNGMVAGSKPVAAAANISVDMVSATAKTAIGTGLSAKITDLENQLKQATTDKQKVDVQKALAKQWDDVDQPAPAAFYYQEVARSQNDFNDWLSAGNRFNDAFRLTQDSSLQGAFVMNAVDALEKANKLMPENLDAKAGLGVAYVNGGAPSPMQGISLLLEVVGKDPQNRLANFNLGLFSMKSGQYDKAVPRFKTIIAQKPAYDVYFYLAESYKQLGMKKEAIDAYEKSKELMPATDYVSRINDFIKELKN